MKNWLKKALEALFYLFSALPLAAWVSFVVLTRNTFRLEVFQREDQLLCLVLTAVPIITWFVLCYVKDLRGMDLPGILFSLAACGWLLVICSQWDDWARAVAVEAIGLLQQNRLRLTALACLVMCLLPLGKIGLDSFRKRGEP